jgi:hypothetical protein
MPTRDCAIERAGSPKEANAPIREPDSHGHCSQMTGKRKRLMGENFACGHSSCRSGQALSRPLLFRYPGTLDRCARYLRKERCGV